jgi:transposase
MTKFRINLTPLERDELTAYVKTGKRLAKHRQYAQILLASDEQVERLSESFIATHYQVSLKTVERVRKSFCEIGMTIFEKKLRKTRSDKKFDARVEAHLIAISCQIPPNGEPKWKLQMLADRLIELEIVPSISSMSVCNLLKKTRLSRSQKNSG